jgi:hypothetical protein
MFFLFNLIFKKVITILRVYNLVNCWFYRLYAHNTQGVKNLLLYFLISNFFFFFAKKKSKYK